MTRMLSVSLDYYNRNVIPRIMEKNNMNRMMLRKLRMKIYKKKMQEKKGMKD